MTAVFAALVLLLTSLPFIDQTDADETDTEEAHSLLLDFGNGRTEWADIVPSGDLEHTFTASLAGHTLTFADSEDGRRIASVDGVSDTVVGIGYVKQTCSWRIYSWNTVEWEYLTNDVSERYSKGDLALGFYPNDTVIPVANPDYREVWTSYRGDSSSSGVSSSTGPDSVATPLQWTNTYAGAVDATILYADGMIYHTVAGKYGAVGMDGLARICCLDPVNKEVLWSVTYSNSGNIEITTPVIVGDMIIVTSGNWHMYCLDRFTGEALAELAPVDDDGDMCKGSKVTRYIPRKESEAVSQDRTHAEAGITNTVYDSGALYFGTSDGLVRCFAIDRENGFTEIWNYTPVYDSSNEARQIRGCFYYHPPVISDYEGTKYLLMGNYGGGLVCVNALSGSLIWDQKVTDTEGHKVGQVTSISICSGGRALVCYSGGEMSSSGGGIMLIDITDGDIIWKQDIRCGKPVVYGERFYCYISARSGQTITDYKTGDSVELVSGYYSLWVDDGRMHWYRPTDALSIGGMTYCDGRVYSMDYSPGTEGATGGWVWCLDSDTGNIVWKTKVSPYDGTAYSMCAPTVVDGKVLVGNDYGAIYVLSETSGKERTRSSSIDYESEGLAHWSWIALFALIIIALAVAVWEYKH